MGWSGHAGGSDQTAQALAQRARQGDQAALAQLQLAASNQPGAWRPDHRNAAIDAWNSLGIGAPLQTMKNPHGFLGDVGKAIGSGLKIAAPFAGLIPGVGPLLGAGLAAGGSALGGAMHGDKFSLLDTALAGGAGYLGGKANPFGGHAPAGGMLPSGAGNATQGMAGAGSSLADVGNAGVGQIPGLGYQSWPGMPPMGSDPGMGGGGSGGGGILGRIFGGGGAPAGGGGFLDKLLQYGPMVAGGLSNAHRQHESDQLQQQALAGSQREWDARAPLRGMALNQILALPGLERPDLTQMFQDRGNVWG